jgi:hypothetical protein
VNRISAWWKKAPPTQKALVGFGVPLVAAIVLLQSVRKKSTPPAEPVAPPATAADPQQFQASPYDLARLTASMQSDDGLAGTVNTPAPASASSMTVRQLQEACSAAAASGGEPYLSELLSRNVDVNDPGFQNGRNADGYPIANPCGKLYVMRLLAAGAIPTCDPATDPFNCKGKP